MNTHSISKLENLTKLYSKSFNTIAIYSAIKENIKGFLFEIWSKKTQILENHYRSFQVYVTFWISDARFKICQKGGRQIIKWQMNPHGGFLFSSSVFSLYLLVTLVNVKSRTLIRRDSWDHTSWVLTRRSQNKDWVTCKKDQPQRSKN